MTIKEIAKRVLGIKSEVLVPLDAESIKLNDQLKALTQMKTARDAQIAALMADKHAESHESKSDEKEQEFIKRLRDQEKELKNKETTQSFSFSKFLNDKRNRNRIEVVDRNDQEVLGLFGDLITIGDEMAITDIHGNILVKGKNISHIIYRPETLGNQVKRLKISIPYLMDENSQLQFVPDLESLEHPDVIYNKKNQQYEVTDEKYDKVRNLLINKDKKIRELRAEKERLESVTIDLKSELDDALSGNLILKNQTDNSQSRLSQAMGMTLQFETKVGDLQRQITLLTELKALYETQIVKLESINEQLLVKSENLGVKTHFEREYAQILDIISDLRDKMPQTVNLIQEPEKIKQEIAPGQPLNPSRGQVGS